MKVSEVRAMNGLPKLTQPQQVIHADGRVSIPKKPDGSVWTLEELRINEMESLADVR